MPLLCSHRYFAIATLGLACAMASGVPTAQAEPAPEPRNIVQLASTGTVEVQQDWLTLTLSITKEGSDAAAVQNFLRQATDVAMTEVKKTVQAGSMEVRTGGFRLQPRYGNEGKMTGWVGNSELVLEGSDFGRISSAAAKAQPLTISNVQFSLSRMARTALEDQARKLAIESFRSKARDIARDFGFSDYLLREINVQSQDQNPGPRPYALAMASRAMVADAAPVPLESGKSQVLVTVSGSIQLK